MADFLRPLACALYLSALAYAGLLPWASAAPINPQIWFHPPDPVHRRVFAHEDDPGYLRLFHGSAPWARTAAHIAVFKIYAKYLLEGSKTDLRSEIAWLKEHHIGLAIEGPVLRIGPAESCGNTEGYTKVPLARLVIERLKRLGGVLDYWAADEPLFFGHAARPSFGLDPCRWSIRKVAGRAAQFSTELRAAFPNAKFVDIEPISNFRGARWIGQFRKWVHDYWEATGTPFAGIVMDIAWWDKAVDWRARAFDLTRYLREARIPVGVIYDGDSPEKTNRGWLDEARRHWREYEALVGGPPNIVIFQSWAPQPRKLLPETSPNTFTNVILDYIRDH